MSEKRRNRYIVITSFIVSFVLYANVMFYRFFSDFITIPVLFQTNNMGDLGNSVFELMNVSDMFFFLDVVLLAWMAYKKYRLHSMCLRQNDSVAHILLRPWHLRCLT